MSLEDFKSRRDIIKNLSLLIAVPVLTNTPIPKSIAESFNEEKERYKKIEKLINDLYADKRTVEQNNGYVTFKLNENKDATGRWRFKVFIKAVEIGEIDAGVTHSVKNLSLAVSGLITTYRSSGNRNN